MTGVGVLDAEARFDLHTHSNCSDGTLTPAELVARAVGAGIALLALTDHDTLAGLHPAESAAAPAGIGFVPGVEISASWRAQTIHVLGLWIDPDCQTLRSRLEAQIGRRHARMRRICDRLGDLGLPGDALLAAVEADTGVPTRTHLARAMCRAGLIERQEEAFRKYLGRGKAAHFAAGWPPLAEVVTWIRDAGGVASLAHPGRYALSAGARRQMIAEFAAAGGTALEVVSGGAQDAQASAALALKYGLEGSVGSDFHSPEQTWNTLGRLAKLPDGIVPVWRSKIS